MSFEIYVSEWEKDKDLLHDQEQRNASMREKLAAARKKRTDNESKAVASINPDEVMSLAFYAKTDPHLHAQRQADSPWMPDEGYLEPHKNMLLQLHDELVDFTEWTKLSEKEQQTRVEFMSR